MVIGTEFFPDLAFGIGQAMNRKITGELPDNVIIAINFEVGLVNVCGIGRKIGVRQAEEAASPEAGENVPARDHTVTSIVIKAPGW